MLLNSFYFYLIIIAHQFLHQKSFSKEEEERAAKPGYVQNNLKVCFMPSVLQQIQYTASTIFQQVNFNVKIVEFVSQNMMKNVPLNMQIR